MSKGKWHCTYVVQLENGVWLAPVDGDPGRTLVLEFAQRFDSRNRAEWALKKARENRPFPNGFVDVLPDSVK